MPQWLFGDITRVDAWVGVLIVVAGFRLGFDAVVLPAMLYASWGVAGFRAVDGQNDVSGSALVVLSSVVLAFAAPREQDGPWRSRLFIASAVLLGWAMVFKQFALLVFPPVARWVATNGGNWRRFTAVALGVAAAFVLAFLVGDPIAFINTQLAALSFHEEIWGTNCSTSSRAWAIRAGSCRSSPRARRSGRSRSSSPLPGAGRRGRSARRSSPAPGSSSSLCVQPRVSRNEVVPFADFDVLRCAT